MSAYNCPVCGSAVVSGPCSICREEKSTKYEGKKWCGFCEFYSSACSDGTVFHCSNPLSPFNSERRRFNDVCLVCFTLKGHCTNTVQILEKENKELRNAIQSELDRIVELVNIGYIVGDYGEIISALESALAKKEVKNEKI